MMTPERWQQINELYHDALELDANRQAAFLNQACAGDAELRDEVESLISSHDQAGSFIAEPAIEGGCQSPCRRSSNIARGAELLSLPD